MCIGIGDDLAVIAVDGANLAIGVLGYRINDLLDIFASDVVLGFGLRGNHFHAIVSKRQHLQRTNIIQQTNKMLGNQLFWVNGIGYAKSFRLPESVSSCNCSLDKPYSL